MRNGVAAIFLCFMLAFVAMPETVVAGCEKVIEVVESIFTEYTEFEYKSNVASDIELHPLKLGYLPDGMEEVKRKETLGRIDLSYMNEAGTRFFNICQSLLNEEADRLYGLDTEDIDSETIKIQNEEITLTYKKDIISFVWIHAETYQINGQSNLSKEELEVVLENIDFAQE